MSTTKEFQTINPTSGKPIHTYSYMDEKQVSEAIENCHNAFLTWRQHSLKERAEHLKNVGKALLEHKEELAALMTEEMGKLLKQSEQEVELCAGICEYTAKEGPTELAAEVKKLPEGGKGRIVHAPLGVIYGIQPWNFPTYQVIRYAIANLMAGNGVLLKHAESVTGCALLLEKIIESAGLPKHLFKVLIINHDQSDDVIKNRYVRGVTLTGSAGAGEHVAKVAGAALKKTVLELGSNDAYIVLQDADLDNAVKQCVNGRVYNNGETCVAAKRFVVVEEVYEAFKEKFVARMKGVNYGDPTDSNSRMGPMAREDLRKDLHEQVTQSVSKGATVLCGGELPDADGFFYPATVLENVQPGQPAYDEELFGPVASLIKAKNTEDAFRIANDSRFGLGGGIFTSDGDNAFELAAEHFDTGMVFINSFGLAQPNMPFGGVKDSGYGREHGGFGMKEFTNAKAIMALK